MVVIILKYQDRSPKEAALPTVAEKMLLSLLPDPPSAIFKGKKTSLTYLPLHLLTASGSHVSLGSQVH